MEQIIEHDIPLFSENVEKEIKSVTKCINKDGYLIKLEKDSIAPNCPSRNTCMALWPGIYINDKLVRGHELINGTTISKEFVGEVEKYLLFNMFRYVHIFFM